MSRTIRCNGLIIKHGSKSLMAVNVFTGIFKFDIAKFSSGHVVV